jgi:hypothetical protein
MVRRNPAKLVGQGRKTKNQPEEYKLFLSGLAKEMLKGGEHKSARSEIKQDFQKRPKKTRPTFMRFSKVQYLHLGFKLLRIFIPK